MTISDIAKMAGVSSAAVSRYFNNGYLSEDKKAAIHKVIEETGYHPSVSAQNLRTKKTRTIALMIQRVEDSPVSRVIAGMQPILDEEGYRLLFTCTYGDPKRELEQLGSFDDTDVDGIILAGNVFSANFRKAIAKCKVPIVIIGQDLPGFSSVYFDDFHAFYSMTSSFIEKGHRNLGYIGVSEKDRAVGEYRHKGFNAALKDHGLAQCRDNFVIGDFSMETAYRCMGELYAMNPDLDAVICATDWIAIGARCWIREFHPELVDRIVLGGQGDDASLCVCYPPISTLRYHYEKAGAVAINRLLDLIRRKEEDRHDVKEIMLGFELVDRL